MPMAYPEAVCLRNQMRETLVGKEIAEILVLDTTRIEGSWRFGSIVQPPQEFQCRLQGGIVTGAESIANSVFLPTSTGQALTLGHISGTVRYHSPGEELPKRSCLRIGFSEGGHLTVVISLWGLVRVLSEEEKAEYVVKWYGHGIEPCSRQYTWPGFREAVGRIQDPKLSAKQFLHAFAPGYYVSGLDSGYAQEILYRARIHPKRRLMSLSVDEQRACYREVNQVAKEAIRQGGRPNWLGLHGQPGGFVPHVGEGTLGHPCPACGTAIVKFAFEGGSCYVCPGCQRP